MRDGAGALKANVAPGPAPVTGEAALRVATSLLEAPVADPFPLFDLGTQQGDRPVAPHRAFADPGALDRRSTRQRARSLSSAPRCR
jgi:hypothetical protein